MGETFLININCSKILQNCDETQYTMFVDSSKMSIVYELTEWIRWMFSLEHCIYLMYENSVIHELEDIQFLSKLKNFEIRPCGQLNCVHKKKYRSLLDNLNLFVFWNNVKVHRFFLEKFSKMDKENQSRRSVLKCTADNIENSKSHKSTTVKNKLFFNDSIPTESSFEGTPLTKKQVLIDNFIPTPENNCEFSEVDHNADGNVLTPSKDNNFDSLNSFKNSGSKDLSHKNNVLNHSSEVKEVPSKFKSQRSHKHVRPFSLGQLLSNIRENFEKQNLDEPNTPLYSSALEEGNSNENTGETASFLSDDNAAVGRKRQRVRRRKRPKKNNSETNDFIPPLSTSNVMYNFPRPNSKASHIRFDIDNEDDTMQTECLEDDLNKQNEVKINKEMHGNTFLQREPEKFNSVDNNLNQDLTEQMDNGYSINKSDNKMDEDIQIENKAKSTDLDFQTCEKVKNLFGVPESSKCLNPELNDLLKLKEKYRNAVVIERFY